MAILLAAGAFALAGCGDDDDGGDGAANTEPPAAETAPPAEETTPTEPSGGGGAERVVLTEFAIDPANPKLTPGKASFEVVNEGSAPHALEIEGGGEEFVTEVLDGGGSETLEADLKAGEYEWYCPVGNHADQGMKGTLTVE